MTQLFELFFVLVTLFIYMCIVFGIALVRKDNGTADIAYGWGFVLLAFLTFIVGIPGLAGLLATLLATIWAARLSIRIHLRNRGKSEDFRYKSMREKWEKVSHKTFLVNSLVQIFLLQGLIIFIVALPVTLLNIYGGGLGLSIVALVGLLIWIKGFVFEAVGDWQLAKFMANPANKGKIMDKGLWKFTRHPNYYGESLMWWGLAIMAFSAIFVESGLVVSLLPFIGPILITFLLLKVSGVPLLEAHFAGKPEWEVYKAKTSVFIPWFPKK